MKTSEFILLFFDYPTFVFLVYLSFQQAQDTSLSSGLYSFDHEALIC